MSYLDILTANKENELNMWRTYGDDGRGVCIQFDFGEGCHKNWENYHLSDVLYGINDNIDNERISEILRCLKYSIPAFDVDLEQSLMFHKSKLFEPEKEVRLLYDNRKVKTDENNENQKSPKIFLDLNTTKSNKLIRYLELDIKSNVKERMQSFKEIPYPKIAKIIIGFQQENEFNNLKRELINLIKLNLGYEVEIELSHIASLQS